MDILSLQSVQAVFFIIIIISSSTGLTDKCSIKVKRTSCISKMRALLSTVLLDPCSYLYTLQQ